MPKTNVEDFAKQLNELVESVGLSKLSAVADGEGGSVVADPGTTQPAEQKQDESNIQPATQGARAAENSADVKSEVPGTNVEDSAAKNTEKTPKSDKSAVENNTTASTPGEDPKVEQAYGSASNAGYPSTTHPADVNKNPEKYSADDAKVDAQFILSELETNTKVASMIESITDETAVDTLGELLATTEAGEKTAEDKQAAAKQALQEYLYGFTKASALVGELTADYLDGMQYAEKLAEEEEANGVPPAEDAGGEPDASAPAADGGGEAEMLMGGEAGMGGEGEIGDGEVDALLEEAVAIAAELGVEPEDVLEAALAEEEVGEEVGMGGEEDMLAAVLGDAGAGEEEEAVDGGEVIPEEELEVVAQAFNKAEAFDQLVAEIQKEAEETQSKEQLETTVKSAMDAWLKDKMDARTRTSN
jgi:hypothetical protein